MFSDRSIVYGEIDSDLLTTHAIDLGHVVREAMAFFVDSRRAVRW
jgi:hypothetical protein